MNIDYTVTALMFPAIPLLMSVYSNRFHSLSKLIRQLHDEHVYESHIPPEWKKQFINLSGRIVLLKWTIMFAAFGFLFNMLTVFALYLNEIFVCKNNLWILLFIDDDFNYCFYERNSSINKCIKIAYV